MFIHSCCFRPAFSIRVRNIAIYISPLLFQCWSQSPFLVCVRSASSNSTTGFTNTGRFRMFSTITNIYNMKTKVRTLTKLFTATGKLIFFDNYRYLKCAPRVTRRTSIRYSSSCHTRVKVGASIFFTAAMIRDFRSSRPRGSGGTSTLHEMHVAQ